jgi:hypothetical protein
MTTETETLSIYDVFPDVLLDVAKNKDQQRAIEEYLVEKHAMLHGSFIELVANNEKVASINEDEISVYTNAVFQITQDERVNPVVYFSTKEIKNIAKFKFIKEVKLGLPIEYERTLQGSEKDYVAVVSRRLIVKHINDDVWEYNFLTQRNPVKKLMKNGTVKLIPKVNRRNVREIKEMLKDGTFLPDSPITINIFHDGEDQITYNEDDWTLLIESATQMDVMDGYHRIVALQEYFEENPDAPDGYLYVSFRNYDLEQAQSYLGQLNSFSTFSRSHTRKLKSRDFSDKIVKELESKSVLNGRIAGDTAVKLKFNEITNFAVLAESIKESFAPQDAKDKIVVTQFLVTYFDYLFGSYKDVFVKNVKENHKKSWINHHNTFVLYVEYAAALYKKYGKELPLDEITRMVDATDFSKETSEFDKIISPQGKVNSNEIKKSIRKYAVEKSEQLLK